MKQQQQDKVITSQLSLIYSLISGGCAGFTTSLITKPVSTITSRCAIRGISGISASYKDILHEARQFGFSSLWRGFIPHTLLLVQTLSFRFIVYDAVFSRLFQQGNTTTQYLGMINAAAACSGFSAGVAHVLLFHPLERSKIQLQTTDVKTIGTLGRIYSIAKGEGFLKLYHGASIMTPIVIATKFAFYEYFKEHLREYSAISSQNTQYNIFLNSIQSGALTGICTSILTQPFNTARINLMARRVNNYQKSSSSSSLGVLKSIYKSKGIKSLYNGLTAHIILRTLNYTILFSSYETTRMVLKNLYN